MTRSLRLGPHMHRLVAVTLVFALAGCASPGTAQAPQSTDTASVEVPAPPSQLSRTHTITPQFYAAHPTYVQALPNDLRQLWSDTGVPEEALSLVVAEINHAPLFAINPVTPRNPASVMKLITTYAALHGLGPAYTWRTELLAGPNATVRQGVLSTPLYIRASGDPTLKVEDVWAMLQRLRLRGISTLPGIVIDRSEFGPIAIDPGAFDNSPDRVYNASPDGLLIGYGAVRLNYFPASGQRRWEVVLEPPLPEVKVDNQVRASTTACRGHPPIKTQTHRTGDFITLKVTGTVPLACGEFSLYRLVLSQPEHAARVVQTMWERLGGRLTGPILDGVAPPDGTPLVSHVSPPLSEVVRTVNKQSNNLVARMMLLALAKEYATPPITVEDGRDALQRILMQQGLHFPELVVENGSGLSRVGRISAASLAALLNDAWSSPRMPEFVSSMAIAGEDGTMKRRLRNDHARGTAHLKTGTLRDTNAVAGYVTGISGKRYLVVILVNHPKAYATRTFMDGVVAWLSRR